MDESYLVNPSVSHGSLEEDEDEVERVPRPVMFMKIVELIFAFGCLAAYVDASKVEANTSKIGLSWATFGSQTIVMAFVLAGYIIGETTPRLVIGHNGVGAILFTASGASSLETWWNFQQSMLGEEPSDQVDWNADMLLVVGMLSLMNAAMLFADTLVTAVLWRLSTTAHARRLP